MKEIDIFFLQQDERVEGCLLALKAIVLAQDTEVTLAWKYRMPFFCYKGKMFCYLWIHKKSKQPYLGFVEGKHLKHPDLIVENRSRMKIFLFDPNQDLPIEKIEAILQEAIDLYRTGVIKIKA